MSIPSNSDSVAQDQIRAFVDRILRLREEAKAIATDIREVYGEAKGNGFDKTQLGKLVLYVEKRATDAGAVAESEALFDLYLSAYDGAKPSHVHAYAREAEPNPRHGAGGAEEEVSVATYGAASSAQPINGSTEGRARPSPDEPASDPQPEPQDRIGGLGNDPQAAILAAGTQAPPVDANSARVDADAGGDRSGAEPQNSRGPAPVTLNFRTHNPETHFLSASGLPRLHGCLKPEICAGSWRALCRHCAPHEEAHGSAA